MHEFLFWYNKNFKFIFNIKNEELVENTVVIVNQLLNWQEVYASTVNSVIVWRMYTLYSEWIKLINTRTASLACLHFGEHWKGIHPATLRSAVDNHHSYAAE